MNRGLRVVLVAAAAGAALLALWLLVATWFLAAERDRVRAGRLAYVEHCASCHGKKREGQPDWKVRLANGRMPAPPHDASGHTWHHSDDELFLITKAGIAAVVPGYASDMPAFKDLMADEEIEAVLAFIKSKWPKRERAYQAARTAAERSRRRNP